MASKTALAKIVIPAKYMSYFSTCKFIVDFINQELVVFDPRAPTS